MRRLRKMMKTIGIDTTFALPPDPEPHSPTAWLCVPMLVRDDGIVMSILKDELHARNVETRPIIGGNFLRQPGLQPFLEAGDEPAAFPGAEHVHRMGLYVGMCSEPWSEADVRELCHRLA